MRPARFRLTIRRSMLMVAIVAALLAAGIMASRLMHLRRVYQERAAQHDSSEQLARSLLSNVAEMTAQYNEARRQITETEKEAKQAIDALQDPETEKRWKELVKTDPFIREFVSGEHPEEKLLAVSMSPLEEFMKVASSEASLHAQLKTKYERAARRPWIAVSPDDDAPEADLMELYLNATERSESIAAKLDHLPLPPGLEMVEPEPAVKK